jgi:alpha-glucosidase
MHEEPMWWQRGIIYQVYPRSFQDSDGDGVGDLEGIIRRLPYLRWLGVDAIWLSPIYPSPMADFGYDITDYKDVDPLFGDLATLDRLIAEAHKLGLRVLLDFVPNHTSEQHPWFLESRAGRENPRRDWYIWRDPAPGGGPPNNWLSVFGGSAWEWDSGTGQYYYHAFLKEQPDLNWRNHAVQDAMFGVLRFWLERGVDGFRIDVLWHLIKDDSFRDNPPNPEYTRDRPPSDALLSTYTTDRPEVFPIIAEMRRIADSFGDRLLIGEIYLPIERLVAYYGQEGEGAHLPMNFHLLQTPWTAPAIAAVVEKYEAALPLLGWPNWVLGNHDKRRVASRIGREKARLAAVLLLTLRGTPTLYYGDELGMEDAALDAADVQDPYGKRVPGYGVGRDQVRTPMQWDDSKNAGFTDGEPWLPVSPAYRNQNVQAQMAAKTSLLSLYKALIDLRRAEPALSVGAFSLVHVDADTLIYERASEESAWLIALNFSAETRSVAAGPGELDIRLSSLLDRDGREKRPVLLRPSEAIVAKSRTGLGH